ncbi:helix-turn-helix domain-containing protein [Patescibacteria group bacterium]|jgi:transcriptional regulator with XRE-family HTH domain|nr:helix-turn-helix domain-containing protein [Patescibacteria group bacterium]
MAFVQKRVTSGSGGFGEALRELRELRGYSRDDVSKATGIHLTTLVAFEEEHLDELIDPVYAERHVKTIITLLEGRPSYFLEKYRVLLKAQSVRRDVASILPPKRVRARDLFVSSRVMAFLGFLLFLAVVGGYVIWQTVLLASSPLLEVTSPIDGARLEGPRVLIEGRTDAGAIVTVNGATAVVEQNGQFRGHLDIPRGLTTLTIVSRRRFGAPSIVTRLVIYERENVPIVRPPPATVTTSTSSTSPIPVTE